MNFTLDSINREREIDKENKRENRKNIKEMKRLMLGMVFSGRFYYFRHYQNDIRHIRR